MPVVMSIQTKPLKNKQLKAELAKELNFLKDLFSLLAIPLQVKGDYEDNLNYEYVNGNLKHNEEKELPKRAQSIVELEEKLEKLKSQNKFNLKSKLVKKSLNSKLNKKLRKKERLNKMRVKATGHESLGQNYKKNEKANINVAKPVFNNEGKLVFSKFDFANIGQKVKSHKVEKDPKKILENLNEQEQKLLQLEDKNQSKVKKFKEKVAWKNVLQKAEGQKVKDDPVLLKKSIKKMEQKRRQSKKQWDDRIKKVEEKKEEKQKKRKENIAKKKKEKKFKIVKAAVKRGRVVI